MTTIALHHVRKTFADNVVAVSDLSLTVSTGELLALVGPTGCGKTTTLRMLAGLESPSSGSIYQDGIDITNQPPHQRRFGMVFQRPALYPTKTVGQNLAFALRLQKSWWNRRLSQSEQCVVDNIIRQFALKPLLNRFPHQLSGGQQQCVALARTLAQQRPVLLLDEPLNNVDPPFRRQLRQELFRFHRQNGLTTIFVTHDPTEALVLGDRVAVLRQGNLQQIAGPTELVRHPNHRFVAELVVGPMQFWDGQLQWENDELYFVINDTHLHVPGYMKNAWAFLEKKSISLGICLQHIQLQDSVGTKKPRYEASFADEMRENWFMPHASPSWRSSHETPAQPLVGQQTIMSQIDWRSLLVFDQDTGNTLWARAKM